MSTRRSHRTLLRTIPTTVALTLLAAAPALAGGIFLTGHDADWHATTGANPDGAQNIIRRAIFYVQDPGANPYFASGIHKFLFVESLLGGVTGFDSHPGKPGIVASGYVDGVDFEQHDASTLDGELDLLGTKYSAVVVASDYGCMLTDAELAILNARQSHIIGFVNSGGGLFAMTENDYAGLTPSEAWFRFVATVVSSSSYTESESGYTVTPFGASLGLTDADVNGNVSHSIFTAVPEHMDVVDRDAAAQIVSVAGRSDQFATAIGADPPASASLRVWPSPLRSGATLTVEWALPLVDSRRASDGEVAVYDLRGARIVTLARGRAASPTGFVSLAWDGRGNDGRRAATGLYLVRATAPSAHFAVERKIMLLE